MFKGQITIPQRETTIEYSANIDLFKVNERNTKKGKKYVQS